MTTVRTTDIVLAASLISTGHKLDDLTINTLGLGTFWFLDIADRVLVTYEAGGLMVEPKSFNQTLVQLSRMCRSHAKG